MKTCYIVSDCNGDVVVAKDAYKAFELCKQIVSNFGTNPREQKMQLFENFMNREPKYDGEFGCDNICWAYLTKFFE